MAPTIAAVTSTQGDGEIAARGRPARIAGWSIGTAALAGAVGAAVTGASWTMALAVGSAGVALALALSAMWELRARARLRSGWLERLQVLTDELANVTASPDAQALVDAAGDRAVRGTLVPRAMRAEQAAFARSVADQCAQALVRLRLQEAERQARADLELLARASPALAASLDAEQIAATIEELVVPTLADTCSLRVVRRGAAEPGGRDRADAAAEPDGHAHRIQLTAQGEPVGELTVFRHARPVSDTERGSLAMLAEPAARALVHAVRFSEQVRTADTLQHSMLPEAILPVANLEVATRYLAATEGQAVGGDFYDVVQSPSGGAVLMVGDVQGKGVEAATLTSTARHTLRSAALDGASPASMLHRLNQALLYGQAERTVATGQASVRFVTASIVGLSPTPTGFRAVVASGGHPPPIVVGPTGTVEQLVTSGPLLGVFDDPVFVERAVELGLSEVLLLYTDGVTEQRRQPQLFDEAQLGRLVRNMLSARHADAVAQLILDTVVDLNPREVRDDIALVVARVTGPR